MHWFDGHLDLTYLALHGRDLTRAPDQCGGSLHPASVTFPSLRAANVTHAVSTIFVRRLTPSVQGDFCFDTPDKAFAAAQHQLAMHQNWQSAGLLKLTANSGADAPVGNSALNPDLLRATLALEGAACLRTPADLAFFHNAGVRIISLAWAEGSQYSGGDQSGGDITPAGLDLITRLDQLNIIHNVSHLSEKAFWTLLDKSNGKIIASHSNCRTLLPDAKSLERHLSDTQIKVIAQLSRGGRGGIIGINFFARFLIPAAELQTRRATISDVIHHIQHIEQIAQSRSCIALGSDMDSGFSTDLLPSDLEGPQHLPRLAEALAKIGWSNQEIQNFAFNNWQNLLHRS